MAAYSWAQIVKKVFNLFPDTTDVDLAEKFGVTRQTIAGWRKEVEKAPNKIKTPEWSSIESVAKGLLKALSDGALKPLSIEDMALVAWADQVVAKRAFFSISNSETMANLFSGRDQDTSFWQKAGVGGGLGAGIGSVAFLLGSTLGPLGMAVGTAVGAATGFYLSKEMQKQNTKLKQELEAQMQVIGNDYGDGLLELAESILAAEKQFVSNKKEWAKAIEKIFSSNKEAASRIDQSILAAVAKSVDDLPSPLDMFDLEAELTNEIVRDLRKARSKG